MERSCKNIGDEILGEHIRRSFCPGDWYAVMSNCARWILQGLEFTTLTNWPDIQSMHSPEKWKSLLLAKHRISITVLVELGPFWLGPDPDPPGSGEEAAADPLTGASTVVRKSDPTLSAKGIWRVSHRAVRRPTQWSWDRRTLFSVSSIFRQDMATGFCRRVSWSGDVELLAILVVWKEREKTRMLVWSVS